MILIPLTASRFAETHICILKSYRLFSATVGSGSEHHSLFRMKHLTETSTGLDWTGSGLKQILLDLDWIRTVHVFRKLRSGPYVGWVIRKELQQFFVEKL